MIAPAQLLTDRSLWFLNLALSGALAIRLVRLKLAKIYRFFFLYLVFSFIRSVVAWPFSPRSEAYRNIWRVTQPVLWLLYILVILELSSLIFAKYRGIQALGRRTIYISLIVCVFLSVALVPIWRTSNEAVFSVLRYLMVERGIDFALVLVLLVISVFPVLFPIQLSRNLRIHTALYAVFFLSNTIGTLIVNFTGYRLSLTISSLLLGVSICCLVSWIVLMTQEGERTMVRSQVLHLSEERLVEQLEKINATLTRAGRSANATAETVKR